ncbi:MAG: helix-turn-helix domain-containing protein [Oceanobacter sp.]
METGFNSDDLIVGAKASNDSVVPVIHWLASDRQAWSLSIPENTCPAQIQTGSQLLLLYCLDGAVELHLSSSPAQPLQLSTHGSVLLNVDETFSLTPVQSSNLYGLRFSSEDLVGAALRSGRYCADEIFDAGVPEVHQRSGCLPALIEDIARLTRESVDGIRPANTDFSDYLRLCDTLVVNTWSGNLRAFHSNCRLDHPLLEQARRWLLEDLKRTFNIEELARACSVSSRTVYQLFRRELNMSPGTFVRCLRIEAAYLELGQTECRSVTETAIDYGFTNFGRFSRQYREHIGQLPSDTLKQRQRTPEGADQRLRASKRTSPNKLSA